MASLDDMTIKVTAKLAWWWPLYKFGVASACALCGGTPDPERVLYWVNRAIVVRINGRRYRWVR